MITTHPPISNATDPPLPVGEGLGVRSMPKQQIEVTILAAGVEALEGLKVGNVIYG